MHDAFLIVLVSIASALVSEGISWVLIYSREDYRKLKKTIDGLTSKLDKKKADAAASPDAKAAAKKQAQLDGSLKALNQQMSATKMRATMATGVVMLLVFGLLSSTFDGVVVAKLPFEPFSLLQGMSHRGLSGSDYTQCSFMFIYVLCQFSIRSSIQKWLGITPAQVGPSMFTPPTA